MTFPTERTLAQICKDAKLRPSSRVGAHSTAPSRTAFGFADILAVEQAARSCCSSKRPHRVRPAIVTARSRQSRKLRHGSSPTRRLRFGME
jgi:hypothetical protein